MVIFGVYGVGIFVGQGILRDNHGYNMEWRDVVWLCANVNCVLVFLVTGLLRSVIRDSCIEKPS